MSKESWYASKLSDTDIIRILVSDDWIIDYDKSRGMYRVSYFEDGHFIDECWFDAYEEKHTLTFNKEEITEHILKTLNSSKTKYHSECKEEADRLKEYLSKRR